MERRRAHLRLCHLAKADRLVGVELGRVLRSRNQRPVGMNVAQRSRDRRGHPASARLVAGGTGSGGESCGFSEAAILRRFKRNADECSNTRVEMSLHEAYIS